MTLPARMQRLFFGLWPSNELRARIAAAVEPIIDPAQARKIPPANLHITLAFLGAVPSDKLTAVMEAASQIDAAPFLLSIERVEVWRGANVLCLIPAPCSALDEMVERLRFNLLARQVEPDQKEFRPHITVAREWRSQSGEGPIGPLEWSAKDFVLVESEVVSGRSDYRIIGRWPLVARLPG
jgi:RNA 2',3'-cyclic 3'-phosphodiesterase